MSEISILVKTSEAKQGIANYFLCCESPLKQKEYTDVSVNSAFPKFSKPIFTFAIKDPMPTIYGFKFGLYKTSERIVLQEFSQSNVILLGVCKLKLEKEHLIKLLDHDVLNFPLEFVNKKTKESVGIASISMYFNCISVEGEIYTQNKQIQEVYFNSSNDNESQIKDALKKVEQAITLKEKEILEAQNDLNSINSSLFIISKDLQQLRGQKSDLDSMQLKIGENYTLRSQIDKHQDVDHLNIDFDILSTSPQGIDELKMKYNRIQLQKKLELERRKELLRTLEKSREELDKAKAIQAEYNNLLKAEEQQSHHYERHVDMLLFLKTLESSISVNDKYVNDLLTTAKILIRQSQFFHSPQHNTKLRDKYVKLKNIIEIQEKIPIKDVEQLQKGTEIKEDTSDDIMELKVEIETKANQLERLKSRAETTKKAYEKEIDDLKAQILETENLLSIQNSH